MSKKYICTNYVECQAAIDSQVQEFPEGTSFKCEVCGGDQGQSIEKSNTPVNRNGIIVGLAILLVAVISIFLLNNNSSDNQNSSDIEAKEEDSTKVMVSILAAMDSVSTMQAEISTAKEARNDAELKAMGKKMDSIQETLQARIKQLEKKNGKDNKQVIKLQQMLTNLRQKYKVLQSQRDSALVELGATIQQLEEAKSEANRLKEELSETQSKTERKIQASESAAERAENSVKILGFEAYLKEGEHKLDLAKEAQKQGDEFTRLQWKKKKRAYSEALTRYQEAKKHFETPPAGKGGNSIDPEIKSQFTKGKQRAQEGIDAMNEILN